MAEAGVGAIIAATLIGRTAGAALPDRLAGRIWRLLQHDLADQPPPRPHNAVTIDGNMPTHARP